MHNKEITPPFIPKVIGGDDVRYFDKEFTSENVAVTPANSQITASQVEEIHFSQFSYNQINS